MRPEHLSLRLATAAAILGCATAWAADPGMPAASRAAPTALPAPTAAARAPGPSETVPPGLVVSTARGEVIGLVESVEGGWHDGRPTQFLSVKVDALGGRRAHIDRPSGRVVGGDLLFAEPDCAGPAFLAPARGGAEVTAVGRQLWTTTAAARPGVTVRSRRNASTGACANDAPRALDAAPAQERADPAYPYAVPLTVAFE